MTNDPFTYIPLGRGDAVPAHEVEAPDTTLEVRILWGVTVLHVAHLTPPRSFYVGEAVGEEGECEYGLPGEVLGVARLPIVVVRPAEMVLVIPARSRGHVDAPGRGRESLEDLIVSGQARHSSDSLGAYEYDLPAGATARVELGGTSIVFQVALVNAGKRLPVGPLSTLEPTDFLYTASSFFLHVGLIAIFAFLMPRMGADDDAASDRDNVFAMTKLLNAAAAREERALDPVEGASSHLEPEAGAAAAAQGQAGAMGTVRANTSGRSGVEGPKDNPDRHLARDILLRDASHFGIVELLGTMAGSSPAALSAVWGHDTASGNDPKNAFGRMFGETIDDAAGSFGLDLTGQEPGGGGYAETIGLRDIAGLDVRPGGVGGGHDPGRGSHAVRSPRLIEEIATVNGRLQREIIQRIVRQNFGRFRFCYESGLRANPSLQGRVIVKFTIDRSGSVGLSSDAGGDLPDRTVTQCVVRAFADLSFPAPDGGMVTVVYPIVLNPL
jgi:hypothetical protein